MVMKKRVNNMECTVRNVKIYYEVYGEGMPVLMIHGWKPDHRLMKGCMEPVFQAMETSWKRIYFDLPGMGKTKGEPWITGNDQMLDVVFGFMDAIITNQKFVLAGESYGGYLARAIINKRPSAVDGLLLICPSAGQDAVKEDAQFQVFEKDEALLSSLIEDDRNYFQEICIIQNERVWPRYKEEVISGLKAADYSFMKNFKGQLSFHVDELEKPYMKPTLMLVGRQDHIVGYRGLWHIIEKYPRASYILLDNAGHCLQIEQDILFTAAVKEWLNRVSAELG
jgi:pimeloyl-ACP methyl ester carboxylesterase